MLCLGIATGTAFGDATERGSAHGTLDVQLRDGLLTLHASNAPLVEVVRAIGREAGFETSVYGELDDVLTRSLSAVPLEQALRQMLSGVSNVMRFERLPGPRLTQVLLFGREVPDDAPGAARSETPQEPLVAQPLDAERESLIAAALERARDGDPQAIGELARLLREDADPAVRGEAAAALGALRDAATVPALQAGALDSEQPVRIRSIRALAAIRDDQATQVLADLLFNHSDRRTRLLAVWALGQHDSPLARSYLEAAEVDGDTLVQQAVARSRSAGEDAVQPFEDAPAAQ